MPSQSEESMDKGEKFQAWAQKNDQAAQHIVADYRVAGGFQPEEWSLTDIWNTRETGRKFDHCEKREMPGSIQPASRRWVIPECDPRERTAINSQHVAVPRNQGINPKTCYVSHLGQAAQQTQKLLIQGVLRHHRCIRSITSQHLDLHSRSHRDHQVGIKRVEAHQSLHQLRTMRIPNILQHVRQPLLQRQPALHPQELIPQTTITQRGVHLYHVILNRTVQGDDWDRVFMFGLERDLIGGTG